MSQAGYRRAVTFTISGALLAVSVSTADERRNKREATVEYVITEAELQVRLMRFADRYAGFVTQAIDDVERLQSTPEARREFNARLVHSIAAAYVNAVDARPQVALLDMVVMTTLGRMVFEEHWQPRFGASADPVVTALGTLERDVWLSQIAANPAVGGLLDNADAFAGASERLASVAEQLPVQVAEERNETIRQLAREITLQREQALNQLLDGIALERERTIEQFVAKEQRLKGLITELHQTLVAGNELALSAGVLVERFEARFPGEGAAVDQRKPSRPFHIDDYRQTLVEAGATIRDLNRLLGSTQQLLDSHGTSELLPQLATAIDKAGDESRAIADHLFLRSLLLIVIALTGYVIARLVHDRLALRLVRRSQ